MTHLDMTHLDSRSLNGCYCGSGILCRLSADGRGSLKGRLLCRHHSSLAHNRLLLFLSNYVGTGHRSRYFEWRRAVELLHILFAELGS